MDIEGMIEEQTIKALTNVIEGDRRDGIHISDLKYDCLRLGYYNKIYQRRYDKRGLLRMAYGTLIHEFKLADNSQHERPLDKDLDEEGWNGIIGTPDEFWEGIVVDKKTTTSVPDKSVRQHHKTQVLYYSAILDDLGYSPIGGAIVYIDLATPDIVVRAFPLGKIDFEATREEILEKKTELEMCLEVGEPPKRRPSFLCNYCDYIRQCYYEDSGDD